LLESSIIFKECLQALSIEKVLKHKHKCTDYAWKHFQAFQ